MEKTGKTTVSTEALDVIIWAANECEWRALNFKKQGLMDKYCDELGYYKSIKNTLERLGLVVHEEYDFNKEV